VRDGALVILVVDDEGVPTVVGKTAAGIEEVICVRVKKKKNTLPSMRLRECCTGLMRTRECPPGRRKNENNTSFFLFRMEAKPRGQLCHLRREGLSVYVADFNRMVRERSGR
jgi:hypothetical protein